MRISGLHPKQSLERKIHGVIAGPTVDDPLIRGIEILHTFVMFEVLKMKPAAFDFLLGAMVTGFVAKSAESGIMLGEKSSKRYGTM